MHHIQKNRARLYLAINMLCLSVKIVDWKINYQKYGACKDPAPITYLHIRRLENINYGGKNVFDFKLSNIINITDKLRNAREENLSVHEHHSIAAKI